MNKNPIWEYLSENNLTTLDEQAWVNEYSSNAEKQTKLYNYLSSNNLTTLDQSSFVNKYLGKPEGVQTAAATAAPVTPEEPQQPTTFQQPSPLLEQELPIGVAAPKEELIERDILFERDKGKPLSAVDPKAFDPEDYDAKQTNTENAKKLVRNNITQLKKNVITWGDISLFDDEEGLVDDLQEVFGALVPGESEKLLDELKDIDFDNTDAVLNSISKYYPEELSTLSQSSSRQPQLGYEKPMNAYQEDIIQNTVVDDSFEEDYEQWMKTRFGAGGEPGAFMEALGKPKSSQEIVSQAIKNLHENKDLKSFQILRSVRNNLDESSEYALIKNTELFLKQYGDDLTINPIKDYVESVDLDSYTKKSTESSELIIDQSKVNPEDIIPGFEDLSSTSQESVRDFLSTQLTNKLESEKINDIASKQEDYEEFYDKIGDKIQNQLKNNSDLFAKSEEEFNAAKNALDDKYTTQFFNKQNKLFNVFSDRLIDLQRSYENGELSFEEFNNQANKLDSEYEEAFNALKTNIDKEYKNEGESVSLSIEQKYSDELNKEIQSLYNEYKLTPEEQKAYSDIYKKAREKLNEDRARYLIPEGLSPDASISALSGFYQSFKNEMGRQLSDLAVSTGSKDLGEYARGLENRYQLPKYGAGEAPFSMRAGKGIATSLPSLLVTAAGTRKLQKYTAPLSKFGTPGKIAAVGINLVGGALAGGATETAQMMASTRRQAIGSGKTVEEADKLADEVFNAQVANFYIYGLDALPFMKGAFKGINKVIPNRYIAGATKIGVGAGFEGVTETFQETVQTAFETQIDKSFNEIGVASYKDFEDNINLNLIKETFLEVYPSTMLMGGGSQALMMTKDEVDIWKEAAKNPKNIQNAIDAARITQGVDSQKALSQKVMWSMLTKGKDFTKAWINAASNLHLVSNTFNGSRGITAQQKSELLNLVDSQEQTINDLNDQTPNMSLLNKLVYNYIQDDINQLNAELESLKGKSKSKTKRNKIQKLLDRRSSELEQIENNPDQNSNALNIISIDNQAPFVLNDKELGNVLETSDNLFGRIANGKISIDLSKTGEKVVSDAIIKSNINITNEIIDKLQNTPNVVLLKTEKEWENNIGQKRERSQTAANKNGKKYVYLPAASLTEDFSAASHELLHDVISPILFETGEDGKVLLDEKNRPIISEEGHNLIDGFLNRLSVKERNALEVDFKANYKSRNERDEYFTLYHRMLVQGNYKRSGLDKVRNLINSIIKSNGYTSGELTAKGIQSFLKDYSNDIAVGRLSDNVKTFASKQIAKGVEVETIKFSKQLGDSIKALVPEKTTKSEYDSEVIGTVYLDLIASNKLHPLINNNLARFGVPKEQVTDEFYEDVKSQLFERSLQRFNPEKNDDLGGFVIDELQRFAIPDIVNQYKSQGRFQTTEQVEAAPTEGRVRPMQIAEETTTEDVVERAEEQEFKVQDKTFREKLGIEKGSDLYNSVIDSVRRTFGTKLPPVTNKKFRRTLIDRFRRELMKPVKDFIGKGEKYKDFVFNNSELILQKIPTRELVRLERREENKIFAEIVSENSSPKQVDDAVSKGLYLLPGASRDSSPTIYRKIETTPEQLWNFLTGNSNDINSARKTALSERLAQELALDATMMVLKDPEFNLIAKVEEVSVMMGEPFPENYDAELGAIIERDPSITRFSVNSIDRGELFENEYINTNGIVVETSSARKPETTRFSVVKDIDLVETSKFVGRPLEVVYYDNFTSSPYTLTNRVSGSNINKKGEGGPGYSYREEIKKEGVIAAFTTVNKGLNLLQGIRSRNEVAGEEAVVGVALQNKETGHLGNKTTLNDFFSSTDGVVNLAVKDGIISEKQAVDMLKEAVSSYENTSKGKDKKSSLPFTSKDFNSIFQFHELLDNTSFERRGTFNVFAIPQKPTLKITKATKPYVKLWIESGITTLDEYYENTKEPYTEEAEAHDIVKYFTPDLTKIGVDPSIEVSDADQKRAERMGVEIIQVKEDIRHTSYPVIIFGKNEGVPTVFHSVREMAKDWDVANPFFMAGRRRDTADPVRIPELKEKAKAPKVSTVKAEEESIRSSKMIMSSSQMSVQEVILEARQKNFSDKAIRDYLVRMRGYSLKDVDQALSFSLNLFESLPESFRSISGGVMSGIKLYNRAKAYRDKLIRDNESIKNPQLSESEIKAKVSEKFKELKKSAKYGTKTNQQINDEVRRFRNKEESRNNKRKTKLTTSQINDRVRAFRENLENEKQAKVDLREKAISKFEQTERKANKNRKPVMSEQEIMDKAIEFLEKQPEYLAERETYTVGSEKKGTKQTKFRKGLTESQASLVSDFQSNLGVRPTKGVAEKIKKARAMLRERRKGARDLNKVKNELRKFIRRSLPNELYKKKEVLELIDLVVAANEGNIENIFKQVEERVIKINNKNLTQKISKILKLDQYAKKDRNGKIIKGRRIDPETLNRLKGIVGNLVDPSMNEADLLKAVEAKSELIQKEIDELKSNANLSAKEVEKMADLITAMGYNQSLLMSDDMYKTAVLDDIHNALNEIVTFGRATLQDRINKRKNNYVSQFEKVYYDVTGRQIDMSQENAEDELNAMRTSMENKSKKDAVNNKLKLVFLRLRNLLANGIEDFSGYMSIISTLPGEAFGGVIQEIVVDRTDASNREYKSRMLQLKQSLKDKLSQIYGKRWEKEIANSRKKLIETEAIIGRPLSRDEIIYLYNQYRDPSNHPNFEAKYGGKYAEKMDKLFEFLTKEDEAFAEYLVNEFFPSLYEHYNPIYKRIYDAEMPWSMVYAGPLRYEDVKETEFDLLQGTTSFQKSMAPGSVIKRVNNKNRIKEESNLSNMSSYIQEMEYWAAYAENLRDINKLFGNEYIKGAIVSIHGKSLMNLINESISAISKKGGKVSGWDKFVNGTNSIFSVTRLALAPLIYLKQLTSAFTYANDIGYRNWAKYSVKNIIEFRKLSKEIMENSVYLKDRYDKSIIRTIEAYKDGNSIFNTQKVFLMGKGISADDAVGFMMGLVTAGDRHAIIVGGMPNYKFYKDRYMKENPGATEQEAINYAIIKFEKDTKKTQQSSDLQDKDLTQLGNPIMRGFNLFLTSPKQYLRKEFYAIRQIHRKISQWDRMAGKGTIGQNLRTLLTYHVIMPMIFQYVTSGFPGLLADFDEEDEEDLLRAAILGNINGLFAVGDLLVNIADAIQGKPYAGTFKNLPIFQMLTDAFKYYEKYDRLKPGPKKDEALNKFWFRLAQLGTIDKWINNLEKLPESKDINEAIMRLLNYSEYQISGGKKSKNKSYVPFEEQGVFEPPLFEPPPAE